jgi:hypothetical protein
MHPPSRAQRIESSACRDGAAQVVVGEIPATWKPKEKKVCIFSSLMEHDRRKKITLADR